jgi:type IV pilus assembly protein PilA
MAGTGRNTGFTLIELLVVVSIIGTIAAIAVPGLLRARMSANEASAIGAMRTINSGQRTYASTAAQGGYATSLLILGKPCGANGDGFVSPDIGGVAPVVKSGYKITVTGGAAAVQTDCNGKAAATGYESAAIPVTLGSTGGRSFGSSEASTIYALTGATAPTKAAGFAPANALQ